MTKIAEPPGTSSGSVHNQLGLEHPNLILEILRLVLCVDQEERHAPGGVTLTAGAVGGRARRHLGQRGRDTRGRVGPPSRGKNDVASICWRFRTGFGSPLSSVSVSLTVRRYCPQRAVTTIASAARSTLKDRPMMEGSMDAVCTAAGSARQSCSVSAPPAGRSSWSSGRIICPRWASSLRMCRPRTARSSTYSASPPTGPVGRDGPWLPVEHTVAVMRKVVLKGVLASVLRSSRLCHNHNMSDLLPNAAHAQIDSRKLHD